ncbi:sulfotransferase [uncultured Paraglaciecola sp.]|uniref:sulfotransferase n=1 Tax=uncultured Paraglaciecola sp. TaxID=1765024 RepID=UPI0030DD6582
MKSRLKHSVINIFSRFLKQLSIEKQIVALAKNVNNVEKSITNKSNPYFTSDLQPSISDRDDIIFITSRFRSGSTLLWNLFRQTQQCTTFYEPFNERKWFAPKTRGDNVDSTHRGVDDYWTEFNGMEDLESLYNEDWIRENLLMDESSVNSNMKEYIEQLIKRAPKRPVLQFNRVDFRLPWLKHNFPKAKILHLYRNPRNQWLSFLTDQKRMSKENVETTYKDAFYLDLWCDDLYKHFAILDRDITTHPYQRFYYIWKLSYLYGQHYSDMSMSFEELTTDTSSSVTKMMKLIKLENVPINELCSVISAPDPERWKGYADEQWFKEHEDLCEKNLNLMLAKT